MLVHLGAWRAKRGAIGPSFLNHEGRSSKQIAKLCSLDLEREQAYLGPIAMCDTQRHMQALHQLLQGCRCLAGMPDLHTHMHEDGCYPGLHAQWHRAKVITVQA